MRPSPWFLSLLLLLASITPAWAQPAFTPTQHVYAEPAIPSTFSAQGLAELEAAAQALKYPFYVLIVNESGCPAEKPAADVCTDQYMEQVAQQWVSQGFDPSTSQMWLLTLSPGKFRFHVGTKYQPAIKWSDYFDTFKSASTGSVKNYAAGIRNVMLAVDKDIGEKGDPEVLVQRMAAQHEREVQAARETSRQKLNLAIATLAGQTQDPLAEPTDIGAARSLLQKARALAETQINDDRTQTEVEATATVVTQMADKLHGAAQARADAAFWAALKNLGRWLLALCVVLLVLAGISRRRSVLRRARADFAMVAGRIRDAIAVAESRQDDYVIGGSLDSMRQFKGPVTQSLVAELDGYTDKMRAMCQALSKQLDLAESLAGSAGFLSIGKLSEAQAMLTEPFEYRTGPAAANQDNPFYIESVSSLDPNTFVRDIDALFQIAAQVWTKLKAAEALKDTLAAVALTGDGFPTLQEELSKFSTFVPHMWFSQHSSQLGEQFYTNLDEERASDPVAYLENVTAAKKANAKVVADLRKLVELLPATTCLDDIKIEIGPVVLPEKFADDPNRTMRTAVEAVLRFREMVMEVPTSGPAPVTFDALAKQAGHIATLKDMVVRQVKALEEAPMRAAAAIVQAQDSRGRAVAKGTVAQQAITKAAKVHRNVPSLSRKEYDDKITGGDLGLMDAEGLVSKKRFFDAISAAHTARDRFEAATDAAQCVLIAIRDLDNAKERYERGIADLNRIVPQVEARRRSSSTHKLPKVYQQPNRGVNEPMDYMVMAAAVEENRSSWEREQRRPATPARGTTTHYSSGGGDIGSGNSPFSGGGDTSPSPSPFSGGGDIGSGGGGFSGGGDL